MFLGVGTELTKQFLIKYVNENRHINTVITIVSYENSTFKFERDIEFIQLDFVEINKGNYPCNIIDIFPIDKDLIELMSPKCLEIFKIMDRADSYTFITYRSRFELFVSHLEFWNSLFIQKSVDLIISSDMPHEAQDYIAYSLGEHYNIKRCFLVQTQMYQFYQIFNNIDSNETRLVNYQNEKNGVTIEDPIINSYYQQQMQPTFVPFYMIDPDFSWGERFINLFSNYYKRGLEAVLFIKINKLYKFDAIIDYLYKRNHFGSKAFKIINRFYESVAVDPDLSKDYIYFPLHFQPERTTSPQGGIYSNQEIAIKMLSFNAPAGWVIYIKEHPRQTIDGRSLDFYKLISSLSNVKLVKKNSESLRMVTNAKVVASITGTAAWEAFCYKIPVILMGNIFFKYADGVFYVKNNTEMKSAFSKIVAGGLNLSDENVIKFINYSRKYFYHGAIDQIYFNTAEIDWELNLNNLVSNINNYLYNDV